MDLIELFKSLKVAASNKSKATQLAKQVANQLGWKLSENAPEAQVLELLDRLSASISIAQNTPRTPRTPQKYASKLDSLNLAKHPLRQPAAPKIIDANCFVLSPQYLTGGEHDYN